MDINIFGEIGYDVNAIDVIEQIQSADEEIIMYMLSGGGSVVHGFGIYDAMRASKHKITVKIFGFSASAASVIAMGADVVEMGDGALMMIHESSVGEWGTSSDHKEASRILDAWDGRLIQAYHNKTGIDKETLAEMVNRNEWMSVDEAIELKFVNSKLESFEIAASANLFLNRTKQEFSEMSEPKAKAEKSKVEAKEKATEEVQAVIIEPVAVVEAVAEVVAVVEPIKAEKGLGDFMAKFGKAEGAQMFLDNVSYSDAQDKHLDTINAEKATLETENTALKTLLAAAKADAGGEPIVLSSEKVVAPVAQAEAKSNSIIKIQK